jgi:hypothetical protein
MLLTKNDESTAGLLAHHEIVQLQKTNQQSQQFGVQISLARWLISSAMALACCCPWLN